MRCLVTLSSLLFRNRAIGENTVAKGLFSRHLSRRSRFDDDDDASDEEKPRRKLTPFNLYMQKMLPVMKQQHPELAHKEVFKLCAESWKTARENPKNNLSNK